MPLKKPQEDVDKWTSQFEPQYWPPYEMLAHMQEELGELAREINHIHGIKKKKSTENKRELGEELADLIFTICCIANSHNINLSDEWYRHMQTKQYGRDRERFKRK